jgi:hypothetical protein
VLTLVDPVWLTVAVSPLALVAVVEPLVFTVPSLAVALLVEVAELPPEPDTVVVLPVPPPAVEDLV